MIRLAADYLRRAESRLKSGEAALERKEYPDVVRYSQECVELSLKGCLRAVGVEYPREHDVSDVLLDAVNLFPDWFRKDMEEMARISRKLALARGPSTYGEEERGIPPSELFGKGDAEEALNDASFVFERCRELIKQLSRESKCYETA